MRGESVQHTFCLVPRFVDETRREKGSAAAQRAAARRVRADDTIAGACQHPLRGTGVFRLEITVEGVDQQYYFAPGTR
jgi:hypothetical protein